MNHQPFRTWLFSKDDISDEQARSLQDHLASCEECRQLESSWIEVEAVIQGSPLDSPEPGFTDRWKIRLAESTRREQNRRGWMSIGITAAIAVILVVIMINQVWSLVMEPGPVIAIWLNQLVGMISNFFILERIYTTSTWLNPPAILIGSFFVVGMISFMSVLWMTAYQKIIITRRIK